MPRIITRLLLPLIFIIVPATVRASQECGFLPSWEVDRAFSEFAPWNTAEGAIVGGCQFYSKAPNFISFMKRFKASKSEADKTYGVLQQNIATGHTRWRTSQISVAVRFVMAEGMVGA